METAKYCLFDVGVVRSLRRLPTVVPESADFGELFEHLIFLELWAWLDYRRRREWSGMNRKSSAASECLDPRSILPSLSRGELERIIRERLDEGDEELGELILGLKAEKADRRSPAAIVDSLMRRHKGRGYEYIEDADSFGQDLLRLGGRANDAAAKGDYVFAVQLLTRAIECAAPHAYEGGNDEESPIMDAVEESFGRLEEMARSPEADPAALQALGAWAARGTEAQWARDGDSWDMSCLDLAAQAARGEGEVRAVLVLCSRFTEGPRPDWSWTYRAERASLIAAGLLARLGDGKARNAYLEEHLFLADIRKLAIDEAMNSKDYGRAIGLCRDGIKSRRERAESTDEFAERLVRALDCAGKQEEAAREFESLLIGSFTDERFAALKKRHPVQDSWIAARDRVIAALETSRRSDALATIYKAERMNERLLALAEKNEFVFMEYLDTIGRAYPERAAGFLKGHVERELRGTASRNSYARCAESILRYGKYAGKKAAEALFDSLVAAYPARRAMRQEFERARKKG